MLTALNRFHGELSRDLEFSGNFIDLPCGTTHYELTGPEDGPIVVFINGFSVPFYLWDPAYFTFAGAGMRVLRYDLLGRGGSDRPKTDYTLDLFTQQLDQLIDALLPKRRKINLSAICMGSLIAMNYACKHPKRVRRVSLIGPAGAEGCVPANATMMQTPGWGDYLMQVWGDQMLLGSLHKHFYQPDQFPEYYEQYKTGMRYQGFKEALLSTMRHIPFNRMQPLYESFAQLEIPTQIVWGEEDHVVPIDLASQICRWLPHAALARIAEAGHLTHYERPDIVNEILLEFLA